MKLKDLAAVTLLVRDLETVRLWIGAIERDEIKGAALQPAFEHPSRTAHQFPPIMLSAHHAREIAQRLEREIKHRLIAEFSVHGLDDAPDERTLRPDISTLLPASLPFDGEPAYEKADEQEVLAGDDEEAPEAHFASLTVEQIEKAQRWAAAGSIGLDASDVERGATAYFAGEPKPRFPHDEPEDWHFGWEAARYHQAAINIAAESGEAIEQRHIDDDEQGVQF